jgi:hypothetical protein
MLPAPGRCLNAEAGGASPCLTPSRRRPCVCPASRMAGGAPALPLPRNDREPGLARRAGRRSPPPSSYDVDAEAPLRCRFLDVQAPPPRPCISPTVLNDRRLRALASTAARNGDDPATASLSALPFFRLQFCSLVLFLFLTAK